MDGIIGEIRSFAFNYPPEGWLFCNGTQYAIQQYAALYTIIGTHFGGNGTTTFNVPNLSGTILTGAQAGIPNHAIWSKGGTETITLGLTQLPSHNHAVNIVTRNKATQSATGTAQPGSTVYLTNAFCVGDNKGIVAYTAAAGNPVNMHSAAILPAGGGLSHSNMAPFLAMNFCICYEGTYPERP